MCIQVPELFYLPEALFDNDEPQLQRNPTGELDSLIRQFYNYPHPGGHYTCSLIYHDVASIVNKIAVCYPRTFIETVCSQKEHISIWLGLPFIANRKIRNAFFLLPISERFSCALISSHLGIPLNLWFFLEFRRCEAATMGSEFDWFHSKAPSSSWERICVWPSAWVDWSHFRVFSRGLLFLKWHLH